MFTGRSTVDVIVLLLTMTICAALLLAGAGIALVEWRDPATDTSAASASLTHAITGILGALLGLLAGRGAARRDNGSG